MKGLDDICAPDMDEEAHSKSIDPEGSFSTNSQDPKEKTHSKQGKEHVAHTTKSFNQGVSFSACPTYYQDPEEEMQSKHDREVCNPEVAEKTHASKSIEQEDSFSACPTYYQDPEEEMQSLHSQQGNVSTFEEEMQSLHSGQGNVQ
jgi:hypothetical protein